MTCFIHTPAGGFITAENPHVAITQINQARKEGRMVSFEAAGPVTGEVAFHPDQCVVSLSPLTKVAPEDRRQVPIGDATQLADTELVDELARRLDGEQPGSLAHAVLDEVSFDDLLDWLDAKKAVLQADERERLTAIAAAPEATS